MDLSDFESKDGESGRDFQQARESPNEETKKQNNQNDAISNNSNPNDKSVDKSIDNNSVYVIIKQEQSMQDQHQVDEQLVKIEQLEERVNYLSEKEKSQEIEIIQLKQEIEENKLLLEIQKSKEAEAIQKYNHLISETQKCQNDLQYELQELQKKLNESQSELLKREEEDKRRIKEKEEKQKKKEMIEQQLKWWKEVTDQQAKQMRFNFNQTENSIQAIQRQKNVQSQPSNSLISINIIKQVCAKLSTKEKSIFERLRKDVIVNQLQENASNLQSESILSQKQNSNCEIKVLLNKSGEKGFSAFKSHLGITYGQQKQFYFKPLTIEDIVCGEDGEYKFNQQKQTKVLNLLKQENITHAGQVRGDGNCFFRSFIILYLKLKISQIQNDRSLLNQFFNLLKNVNIEQPTNFKEYFQTYDAEQLVSYAKRGLQESLDKIGQSQNPLKQFIEELNIDIFDFSLQLLTKSLLLQVYQKSDVIKNYQDENSLREEILYLNKEAGSDVLNILIESLLNCQLYLLAHNRNNDIEWNKIIYCQDFYNGHFQPYFLSKNQPKDNNIYKVFMWYKQGHYYYLLNQEQMSFIQKSLQVQDNATYDVYNRQIYQQNNITYDQSPQEINEIIQKNNSQRNSQTNSKNYQNNFQQKSQQYQFNQQFSNQGNWQQNQFLQIAGLQQQTNNTNNQNNQEQYIQSNGSSNQNQKNEICQNQYQNNNNQQLINQNQMSNQPGNNQLYNQFQNQQHEQQQQQQQQQQPNNINQNNQYNSNGNIIFQNNNQQAYSFQNNGNSNQNLQNDLYNYNNQQAINQNQMNYQAGSQQQFENEQQQQQPNNFNYNDQYQNNYNNQNNRNQFNFQNYQLCNTNNYDINQFGNGNQQNQQQNFQNQMQNQQFEQNRYSQNQDSNQYLQQLNQQNGNLDSEYQQQIQQQQMISYYQYYNGQNQYQNNTNYNQNQYNGQNMQ